MKRKAPLIPITKKAPQPKAQDQQQAPSIDEVLLKFKEHAGQIRRHLEEMDSIATMLRNEVFAREQKLQEQKPK